jgi:3-dehydroquinate dehydratase / shikimate dehydrogenase
MTHLIVPIAEASPQAVLDRGRRALASGATLVEVRLDAWTTLAGTAISRLSDLPTGRWIATLRSIGQGGGFQPEPDLWLRVMRDASAAGAGWLDVEWHLLSSGLIKINQINTLAGSTRAAPALILSHHRLDAAPFDISATVLAMEAALPGAVAKLAWNCDDINDSVAALELMRARPAGRMLIPMGDKGLAARLLAGKAAGFGTFCVDEPASATAPGQPLLRDAVEMYRVASQTPATQVFGVIGSPIGHSRSPALFNALFAAAGRDAVHLPFRVDRTEELGALLDAFRDEEWLRVRGLAVTVPHKAAALAWVGAKAEPLAHRIGALNTLRFDRAGVEGFNTDYRGAMAALGSGLPGGNAALQGRSAAVLGAGGAARAVVAGLVDAGCRVTVYNRSPDRAQDLARHFGCDHRSWDARHRLDADLVVNCTSVGMFPVVDETPLPAAAFRAGMVVLDTVYNPLDTRLLREAREAGCHAIDGLTMFVHQAAGQYELWFGEPTDVTRARQILTGVPTA